MTRINWDDGTYTNTDGTFLGMVEAIADEWNREDWKEVIAACKMVAEGGTVPEFEAKWNLKFERA